MSYPFCPNTIKIFDAFMSGEKRKEPDDSYTGDEDDNWGKPKTVFEMLTNVAKSLTDEARDEFPQFIPKPQHAWGKSGAEGGLQLPARFENVTMLGPMAFVGKPKGGVHLPHRGTPHANALVLYQDGIAYKDSGKDVKLWCFDEMVAIQTKMEDHNPAPRHEFTLFRNTCESLVLGDCIHILLVAAAQIKLAVFRLLDESFVRRFEAGKALMFGSVTVHKQNGLQWADTTMPGRSPEGQSFF